jgi:hypothetical protein
MTAIVLLPPLVRALTTALLVVSASAAAEALGPFWGALIASLPVSAGPAYVFLAMRQNADFVAASALSSFVANASTGLFLIVYGVLAVRTPPWSGLGIAVMAWIAASVLTHPIIWSPSTALLLNLAVYGAGFVLLSPVRNETSNVMPAARRRWFELPARAAVVAAFVSLVITASSILGPDATGIAAVFPISLISLIVIVRPRIGGPASSRLAADALRAMLGFGIMLLALHLAIRPWGVTTALVIALLVSAFWSAALLLLGRPTRPRNHRFKPGPVNAHPPSPPISSPRLTRISGLCCRARKPPPANTE